MDGWFQKNLVTTKVQKEASKKEQMCGRRWLKGDFNCWDD